MIMRKQLLKISFIQVLISCFLLAGTVSYAQNQYNVLDYGAVNDGSQKITEAVKKAIAVAAEAGGGTVYFPAGEYLTGPIHLKSNITLFIEAGALLKFSDDFDDYLPMVPSRWEGNDVVNFSPLIYAYEAENIAIRGRGTIDGQGKKWWNYFFQQRKEGATRSQWQEEFARQNKDIILPDQPGMIELGFLRPPFIQPMYCKNVLIEGITIQNSPFWTVNPEFCENVTVTGVTINNPDSPNTDGINPESCKYVHISNCHISVGDDCITIKSGRDGAGRKKGVPAENYTITNCTMLSGHGGVVIGSEMSGGVKKITISNCIFDGTDRGIRIKSMRGRGGTVEEIRVDNIIMKNIKEQVFMLNMEYQETPSETVSERTPQFKNIHFSNVTAEAGEAGFLLGLEEMPIDGVTFNDINITANKGFTIKNANNLEFHQVQVNTRKGPALQAENVSHLEIDGVKTLEPHTNTPVILLNNVNQAFLHDAWPVAGTDVFLKLQGEKTKNITVEGNNFSQVATPIQKGDEVVESLNTEK